MARPIPNNSSTRWTIRLIPLFIVAAIGFAKYVVIAHVCVDYIYTQRNQQDLAAALMTLYCVFFTLTVLSYARTFYAAHTKPGLVPLSDKRRDALRRREERRNNPNTKREADDLEEAEEPDWMPVDMNPDSPGLERFYSKQIFTCEPDGRPRWCTLCWNWKPDRASHSTELGRCVRKMDHLCPWVGGMVAENSFNFFFQFTIYCTLYLSVCLATTSYALRKQIHEGKAVDGRIIAVMALSGLFLFFTIGMALTSGKYIFENITNIDVLRSSAYHYVAVRIPTNSPPGGFNRISYPLPLPGSEEEYAQINGFTIVGREMSPVNTFAIVRTNPGENVFDLGPWRNFKAIMGNNLFEWMFPVKHSPCCDHDSMTSDYEYGPLIDELKKRHKLPGPDDFAPRHSNPPGSRAPAISILDEH